MVEKRHLQIEGDPDVSAGLDAVASARGISTVELIREMIERFLEDEEDYRMAAAQLEKPGARYTLAEMKARFDVDD